MAGNPFRGEATVDGGERGELKLCFDANAFCHAEDVLSITTDEIVEKVQAEFGTWVASQTNPAIRPRLNNSLVRSLLWAGLQRHHKGTHLIEAGEILSDLGPGVVIPALLAAFYAAFGTDDDEDDGEGEERSDPPKPARKRAARGTG